MFSFFVVIFLIFLALSLWDTSKSIRSGEFTEQEKGVLIRQQITLTLLCLFIVAMSVKLIPTMSILRGALLTLPLFYIGISAIRNELSVVPFRGQLGPTRGLSAIGMGILEITIGLGIIVYYLSTR